MSKINSPRRVIPDQALSPAPSDPTKIKLARKVPLEHPYFELPEPTIWDEPGTYVQTDHEFVHTVTAEWNHGLGEIVTALLDAGLTITGLVEHDSVAWNALPGLMDELPGGEYRLRDRPCRLPHTYTLQAVKHDHLASPGRDKRGSNQ